MYRILLIALVLASCGDPGVADISHVADHPTYDDHVRPLLADHCLLCHGERPRGEAPKTFRLDVYEDVGGKLGAGSMADLIVDVVEKNEMPPLGELGPNGKKLLRRWLEQGAPKSKVQ